jgi:hypothetical protein
MTELPRFAADAAPETIAAAVLEVGAAIVERAIDEATCDRLAEELAPHLEVTPTGGDDFTGRSTKRTGALLARLPTSPAVVAHPLVLDVAERVLWPQKSSFQLHLTQAISIGPGSPAQGLHRDQWCFDFFPFPDDVHVELSTIWALTDFTEENGATRVVPGSHGRVDPGSFTPDDSVAATMPRGSVVLYTGRTVHGGGANESDTWRTGLNVDYVLGWLRQEENQYLSVPREVAATLPEPVQRLMGYQLGAFALGYVDDLRDPLSVLRGESARTPQAFGATPASPPEPSTEPPT